LRKGFAFPRGIYPNQSPPLGWKAEPSSRAEEGGGNGAGKPEAFRKSGGKAASSPTLTRAWKRAIVSFISLIKHRRFHVFWSTSCIFMAFFLSFRAAFRFVFWRLSLIPKDFLGSFRLNSIFFAFLTTYPRAAGRYQTHPRALPSGSVHRSTEIGYHIRAGVSSAKCRIQDSRLGIQGSEQLRSAEPPSTASCLD
jgi:hypothetical protein